MKTVSWLAIGIVMAGFLINVAHAAPARPSPLDHHGLHVGGQ